jgi:murein DD-endopeptidase MepM/ murein hydrolase activator NlpD
VELTNQIGLITIYLNIFKLKVVFMKRFIFISIVITYISTFSMFTKTGQENNNNHIRVHQIISNQELAYPIDEFKKRITKKTFGLLVSPKNSPVSPERFTGYHTGVDVEYQDMKSDVPVYAVADGTVVYSGIVSGYGGVFVIKIKLDGLSHLILYGHIRPGSLPEKNRKVFKGEKLALLGTGYTKETDGERKHLHFAVLSGGELNLKGYVQTKDQLSGWIDPLSFW